MRNRMVTHGMVLGMALALFVIFQGCATHKYVDEQIGPLNQKIQSLQEQAGKLGGDIKDLDAKTSKMNSRLDGLESRVDATDAKVGSLSSRIDGLKLDRKILGDLREGVTFNVGSSELSAEARIKIDAFLSRFAGMGNVHYVVIGYADKTGKARANFDLGVRRAMSTAKHMITNKGIDATRVSIRSEGTAGSLGMGDAMDRRVEIVAFQEIITTGNR